MTPNPRHDAIALTDAANRHSSDEGRLLDGTWLDHTGWMASTPLPDGLRIARWRALAPVACPPENAPRDT
jgi:hypothetical protein